MGLNSNERQAIMQLAECIKALSCMVGADGDEFIAARLTVVHEQAAEAIKLLNTFPDSWKNNETVESPN